MKRRQFLNLAGGAMLGLSGRAIVPAWADADPELPATKPEEPITLFLGGDVMTGRGIDQVLPHPSDPALHEAYMRSAVGYVELAEEANGPIERPVGLDYIWGDALPVLDAARPDARIVNLETAITTSERRWTGKGIHYRMHPDNVGCLTAAGIDCCALANNHTLDFHYAGLAETLDTLRAAGIHTAGAGADLQEARAPATIELAGKGRLLVYSMAFRSSGTMRFWVAAEGKAGVNELYSYSTHRVEPVLEQIRTDKRPGDLVVASIHWGGNWGYFVPPQQRTFARQLIEAGVDVIHGHSSHHAKGIEVVGDRPVLYGCGDLINDYEGIETDREQYRGELVLMYFVTLDARTAALRKLRMKPMRLRNFRLNHASEEETAWLAETLHRQGRRLNTSVSLGEDGFLELGWEAGA